MLIYKALDRDTTLRALLILILPLAPIELFLLIPLSPYLFINELYKLYNKTDSLANYSTINKPPSQASVIN
jgi:hypothetical protein